MSDQLSYRSRGASLCKGDPFDVLARNEQVSIATCRLGTFVPLTADAVKALPRRKR